MNRFVSDALPSRGRGGAAYYGKLGSALQLGRDFRQQLFCRIPPSRLSGKTKCDCVLASSSSLNIKYTIIIPQKRSVVNTFPKKERKMKI
jgi:hypothetical protein